ncbi:MAG: polyhydroxyalkanoate synthesis repressor PhaR [Pyrinomonadaceae bacterium]|nr:polyhydroxyalkanoate synthesis repressor PhaR [Pyrinomonadaceae bacterium]
MVRKQKTDSDTLVIKRYGNRRLYNTETRNYVNYQDLIVLARTGTDFQVIDSNTKDDVTKAVLIQLILEEEKNNNTVLPTEFLFQLLRSREDSMQDFFKNHLSASFDAYLRTKEEFDKRFRSILEMTANAPQMWEKLIPGAEAMREIFSGGKNKNADDEEDK